MFRIMPGPIIPGPPPHGQLGQGVTAGGAVVLGVELSAARTAALAANPMMVRAAAAWASVFTVGDAIAVSPVCVY